MTVVSLILVVGGIVGSIVGPSWLIGVSFLGLFGPFLLREIGWRRWRDDFQREAMMRSGMHALVAVGLLLTLVIAVQGVGAQYSHDAAVHVDAFPVSTIFATMALTWGLSWLIQFWGARRGACRILLMLVSLLTVLVVVGLSVLALTGTPISGHDVLRGVLQIGVGWGLVLASRRWPRITGLLLLLVGWYLVRDFMRAFIAIGDLGLVLDVVVIGTVPFLVPGLALAFSHEEELS